MNKKMQGLSQIVLTLACAAIPVSSIAADTPAKSAAKAASSKEVERGRYLANGAREKLRRWATAASAANTA